MIALNNLTVEFSGSALFKNISFQVNLRDRIGLVGKNGAGKSTMLQVLSGKIEPTKGSVSKPVGYSIGYLSQDLVTPSSKTVFDETYGALKELTSLQVQMEDHGVQLTERTDYETESYLQLIVDMNDVTERFNLLGGHQADADVERVLFGLGFKHSDLKRPVAEFSGGWQMRVELAKILVQRPDLLLLDEPTNHLDIVSIQWLETFLGEHHGSVILVSHDRAFLDNVTARTIEISLGKIFDYKTNYSNYVLQRAERREQQFAAYENQRKFIEETERFIDRFRAKATKANQVQSRIKALEKIDRIEVDQEDKSTMRFRFPPAPRAGKVVIECSGVGKNYGELNVFSDIDLLVARGERIALVGKNGEGKTTFSKIVVGELRHDGDFKLGHNVALGYYAQDQAETLNGELTVFQTIDDVAKGGMRTKVRDILGSFLFSGEDVDKKVKVLSGGERARLALAKLMLDPVNLLVLDEPTNHLDMRSKDILKDAILKYEGALILVSHDRSFLEGLTDKVIEFTGGGIKQHIGDIRAFLKASGQDSLADQSITAKKDKKQAKTDDKSPNDYKERKAKEKELRKQKSSVRRKEDRVSELEKEIVECDEIMLDPVKYQEKMNDQAWLNRYKSLQSELDAAMLVWEEACEKLELMEAHA